MVWWTDGSVSIRSPLTQCQLSQKQTPTMFLFSIWGREGRGETWFINYLKKTYTNIWLSGYLTKWVSRVPLARLQRDQGHCVGPCVPFSPAIAPQPLSYILASTTALSLFSVYPLLHSVIPFLLDFSLYVYSHTKWGFAGRSLFSDHLFLVIVCALEPRCVHLVALQTPHLWL